MGFTEAVRICLSEKYITFSGRASRSEYWWFYLFFVMYVIVLVLCFVFLLGIQGLNDLSMEIIIVFAILALAVYIPFISVWVRRFHDKGLSGWLVLVTMLVSNIPYVGFLAGIWSLVMTIMKGTDGDNAYGPDPLGIQNSEDIFS